MKTKRELYRLGLSRSEAVAYHKAYVAPAEEDGGAGGIRAHAEAMAKSNKGGGGRYGVKCTA